MLPNSPHTLSVASPCTAKAPEQAAISSAEKSEFLATFPAADTLTLCSSSEEGEERGVPANGSSFCSVSRITSAAQEGNKTDYPSAFSALSRKSPPSFVSCFFAAYLPACVEGTNGCSPAALLPLPPVRPESPVVSREAAAAPGDRAASQQRCFSSTTLPKTLPPYRAHRRRKEQNLNLHS